MVLQFKVRIFTIFQESFNLLTSKLVYGVFLRKKCDDSLIVAAKVNFSLVNF